MSDRQLEVQWVPCDTSQFITWGTELRHYQVVENDDTDLAVAEKGLASLALGAPAPREPLNGQRSAVLLDTVAEPHYIKCVNVWGGQGVVVAAGQASGRVSFVTFRHELGGEGGGGLLGDRELQPRTPRPCSALGWHPGCHNILASGYEKHRSDFGLLVWDLAGQDKPVTEIGMTDSCSSLAWFPSRHSLAAGVNGKMVRLYDTRAPAKPAATTLSRATSGLTVDPASEYRVAAHFEAQVVIWDTRNFEKPVVSLETGRPVARIAWCPTRPGLLANSGRDSPSILLHDIMSWAVGQEDGEPAVSDRSVAPAREVGGVASFAWHPARENTILALGARGFSEWTVSDRLTLNWSARHNLVWSAGRAKLRSLALDESQLELGDISILMERRARAGYTPSSGREMGGDLGLAWGWLAAAQALAPAKPGGQEGGLKCPGARASLLPGPLRSETVRLPWAGLEGGRTVRVFRGEEREAVLRLCGWGEGCPSLPSSHSDPVSRAARAAAVAVFRLDLRTAMRELQQGSEVARQAGDCELANILCMVGVAVSGYSSEGAGLWRETVAGALHSLPDPALRALFTFLTCQGEVYTGVLQEEGLLLADRLGFAATFLSDSGLGEWVEEEWRSVLQQGRLEGLLLCGNEKEAVQLLQQYVDRTGDVQSASWLSLHCLSADTARSEQVAAWVESYRGLLDQWRLFPVRAELDIALTNAQASSQPAHQVYVSCHYCGKSVSPWYKGLPHAGKTGSLSRQGGGANKVKLQSCPSCKKPLPRCAVCLVNMGTASGTTLLTSAEGQDKVKVSQFGEWFTWCQSCRHGGHANHLLHWFSLHSDCPVTGCSCRCAQLDADSEIGM